MANPDAPLTQSRADDERGTVPAWLFWCACAVLTALYFSTSLYHLSDLPLLDPDEPRYAGAGRAMANGSSLLVPEFNGEPRINKPPLFYWLVALSTKIGGAGEASARAPSILMGLLMLWGTIWLGRKVFGAATGLFAGMILASTPLFFSLARCCITDMTLSTFLAGTLGCLMLGMLGLAPPWRAGWIATLLYGLSILTKATSAFAVLLAIVIQRAMSLPADRRPAAARWLTWLLAGAVVFSAGGLLCESAGKRAAKAARSPAAAREAAADSADDANADAPGVDKSTWTVIDGVLNKSSIALALAAVAILLVMASRAEHDAPQLPPRWKWRLAVSVSMGLWWYILLIAVQGWATFKGLLAFEVAGRLEGNVHREGMHYYLLLLPATIFPWSPGLLSALGLVWTAKPSPNETPREELERRADSFLLAWVLGIVFFFSIPGAKLPTYILPAMPAAALLTARYLFKLGSRLQGVSSHWIFVTQVLALVFIAAQASFPLYVDRLPPEFRQAVHWPPPVLWLIAIGTAALMPGAWLLAVRGRPRTAALIATGATFIFLFSIAPLLFERLKPRSTKLLALHVKDAIRDCKQIKTISVAQEGLSYYLEMPIEKVKWKPPGPNERAVDLLAAMLPPDKPAAIFIDKRIIPRIFGKEHDFDSMSAEELKQLLPRGVTLVFRDRNYLVVRN